MNWLIAIAICFAVHESGHFLAALSFGKIMRFRFVWGKIAFIPIPRYVWDMPSGLKGWQVKIVALAGFSLEFFMLFVLPYSMCMIYLVCAVAHIVNYRIYAGEHNDFSFL